MELIKNITRLSVIALSVSALSSCGDKAYHPDITKTSSPMGTDVFKPDSVSIAQNYTIPEWFKDAKFGIFIHWGVYSVPAYGDAWYSRWMYKKGSDINRHHEKKYGKLTEFGYKDFIPMFTADDFNAEEWTAIFKASGAKYVVPVAEHHDGFAMYKSAFNKWNATEMGPKRDVLAELKAAIIKDGMRFGLSSHRAENPWFFEYGMKTPSDVQDTTITLYGERIHQPGGKGMTPEYGDYEGSNERSRNEFLMHTYELIDQYQPELIWFDWTVGKYPFQPTFYKFMSYYYNNALDWGKEVVVNTKCGFGDESQVFDIERGKSAQIREFPWQTDTSIGKKSWGHTPDEENKSANHIIDDMVDIVSKNGNLLLNVGPTAAGKITDEQRDVLFEIGDWLKINGEAIFNTRPWVVAMEGDNEGTSGYMTDNKQTIYTAQDIRFTTNDNNLYAISLDWADGDILIKSLSKEYTQDLQIESVEMLGYDGALDYELLDEGLRVTFPDKKPSECAHALKIQLSGTVYSKPYIEDNTNETIASIRVANHSSVQQDIEFKSTLNDETITEFMSIPLRSVELLKFNHKGGMNQFYALNIDGKDFYKSK